MDIKDLAEILEEDFSEAVEVKNPKSLHRCFALLTGTYVEQETHERRFDKQHKLISLGFTALALIIAAFNLTLILS
jgi:hypothetical protein